MELFKPYLAFDIGAGSGRAFLGFLDRDGNSEIDAILSEFSDARLINSESYLHVAVILEQTVDVRC